jgi:hypothetical protein
MGRCGGEKGREPRFPCVHFRTSIVPASRKNAFLSPFKPKIAPFSTHSLCPILYKSPNAANGGVGDHVTTKKTTAPEIRTPLFDTNYQFPLFVSVYALC